MGNHEWTVQNNSQHWVHKTQYEDKQIYIKNISMWRKNQKKNFYLNKGNNKITELRTILQRESIII